MVTSPATRIKLDAVIERGIMLLVIFTPLAFGAVQAWSSAIMEIGAFLVFGAWFLKRAPVERMDAPVRILGLLFVCFVAIVLLQLMPLPQKMLALVSASTAELYM